MKMQKWLKCGSGRAEEMARLRMEATAEEASGTRWRIMRQT